MCASVGRARKCGFSSERVRRCNGSLAQNVRGRALERTGFRRAVGLSALRSRRPVNGDALLALGRRVSEPLQAFEGARQGCPPETGLA
jgi:hypothetical protein